MKTKLLDETCAGDEFTRICMPGGAILQIWPWTLFARTRRARHPASKALK